MSTFYAQKGKSKIKTINTKKLSYEGKIALVANEKTSAELLSALAQDEHPDTLLL